MFVDMQPPPSGLEDPCRITYADRWQMVARNLAQLLSTVAAHMEERTAESPLLEPDALRRAFAEQCKAHGLFAE